ncbi:MAG: class I SAM-dependent methyltransferase [Xanthomonadaceae bacterium]|nr:class I SAM-dependent methyltransferase [Xanthomonadaceae bacterium]
MTQAFAYDVLQYPALIFPQMHPSRLAAIGRLHGLASAAPTRCRLLEVGCGDALQLLTLAQAYPHAQFVGVDLSHAAIARGEAMRQQLGLANLQLHAVDICQWQDNGLPFDYILAHGFYSWVPPQVQTTLLALCRQQLAADGIAYVSYNAFPGCHLRSILWDMLRQHTAGIDEPAAKIKQAREFLEWLSSTVTSRAPYADVIRHEARDLLNKTELAVFYHDDLADLNLPCSITEFASRAGSHGLQFLAEADIHDSSGASLSEDTAASLAAMARGDVIRREQYLDYLKGRRFRQTLLCRAETNLRRPMDATVLTQLQAVGNLHQDIDFPDSEAGQARPGLLRFCNSSGAAVVTDSAAVADALARIGRAFPAAVAVQALLETESAAAAPTDPPPASTRHEVDAAIRHTLLKAFEFGLLQLHCDPPTFATQAGTYPRLNPLSRLQLEQGKDMLASLRPSLVSLDNVLGLELVRLLDGQRDRAALLAALAQRMTAFPVSAEGGQQRLQPVHWWTQQLNDQLEDGLRLIAQMALLENEG